MEIDIPLEYGVWLRVSGKVVRNRGCRIFAYHLDCLKVSVGEQDVTDHLSDLTLDILGEELVRAAVDAGEIFEEIEVG